MTIIATWAHSRSASTAFLRMMIERGDVLVLHEPLLALQSGGTVSLPMPVARNCSCTLRRSSSSISKERRRCCRST